MNDDYSDAFKSIIPEAPSSDGWADGARRKRHNRGRAMAGVAAAAAIALVVPLSLTMGGNATLIATPGKSETPSPQVAGPSPDPATDAPGAAACWEAPMQARRATPEGATDGAVRAWLCGDADVSGIALGTIGPLEPLVEGVDQIIDFIQSQQTLDESGLNVCTEEYTLAYRVVLDYGDGTSHVVPGELHGCKTIDDGPTVRTGGQELYDLALDLWREQREETGDGDGAFLAPDCPPQTEALQNLLPVEIVTGFTCVLQGEGGFVTGTLNQLPDDLVDAIRMGISADSKPGQGEDGSDYFVTMTGAWGDSLLLRRLDDGVLAWTGSDGPMLWAPPADVLAQLDALARSGSNGSVGGPEPSEPTSVAQPEGCEGVVPRDRRATESEVRELPDSTERIWLCDGGVTMEGGSGVPFEPLVADDLVAEAVEAFNSLSPAEPDRVCTLDAGPSYIVVYEDSDGGRQEAGLELFGWGGVRGRSGQSWCRFLLQHARQSLAGAAQGGPAGTEPSGAAVSPGQLYVQLRSASGGVRLRCGVHRLGVRGRGALDRRGDPAPERLVGHGDEATGHRHRSCRQDCAALRRQHHPAHDCGRSRHARRHRGGRIPHLRCCRGVDLDTDGSRC